jgi:hypothetical protein
LALGGPVAEVSADMSAHARPAAAIMTRWTW